MHKWMYNIKHNKKISFINFLNIAKHNLIFNVV